MLFPALLQDAVGEKTPKFVYIGRQGNKDNK